MLPFLAVKIYCRQMLVTFKILEISVKNWSMALTKRVTLREFPSRGCLIWLGSNLLQVFQNINAFSQGSLKLTCSYHFLEKCLNKDVETVVFSVRLLHAVAFSKKLRWLAQTKVITLKTLLCSKRMRKTTVATQL